MGIHSALSGRSDIDVYIFWRLERVMRECGFLRFRNSVRARLRQDAVFVSMLC
ncbi:hypothetical protein M404DRAFT_1002031 [Pisolithus tinctorius Marx 270]|uniref:Uncharacterized protein n=1 Tax=Pisolithus tinctorius Marx 270 TaxID=870435 RepID=A0A0C3J151_PISTI|nr:hypothetical protein M404DRAFT_1009028 [Pisolithus tinctorius Marx 270]KIO02798.1 hypothetical protein M404DRAFT_1002031 [Pisolithus tinctorius Marx 270]